MGAVFALASATNDITTVRPEAVAIGMRITFAVAAIRNQLRSASEFGRHLRGRSPTQ